MKIARIIYIIAIALLPLVVIAQNGIAPKYEYRAVWLTTIENLDWPRKPLATSGDTVAQKRELVMLLDSLQQLNVNTILLQTRVRGDVIYPSRIEPFSHILTGKEGKDPGYDPLAFAIEECHKRGMQLHAWIVTFPLGKDEHMKRLGSRALSRTNSALCTRYKGSWYMEPGNPAIADYICKIATEITSRYDVDGIHLDYVRYPDRTKGYPDGKLYRRYGKGLSLADWRRANVTRVVRKVYDAVKSIKPWVRVSCAPLGKYGDLTSYSSYGWNAHDAVFQEAQEWMRDGIMDILFPMLYFKGNNFYPFVLDWQENSFGRHIVAGIGVYRLLPEYGGWPQLEIARQLNTTRSAGVSGTALFRTQHLYENSGGAARVYSAIYPKKALVPPLDWCPEPLPASPAICVNRAGHAFCISWEKVEALPSHPAVKYNIYACIGDTVVDIDNVDNLLCATTADTLFEWHCRTNKAVSIAVTAVDAYGRESVPAVWNAPPLYEPLKEILLPEPDTWGQRIEVFDIYGRKLFEGRYSTRVIVEGMPHGDYRLKVLNRDGRILSSRFFRR